VQGVKNIKLLCAQLNPLYVFIAPPAMSALIARLKHRNTESDEAMARRLRAARAEVEYAAVSHCSVA
jgi:guanylate kinase